MDLGSAFAVTVRRQPGQIAIVDGERRLSYADWYGQIKAVAGALREMGLQAGEHFVAIMRNRYEVATLYWASHLLGLIFTPVSAWRASPVSPAPAELAVKEINAAGGVQDRPFEHRGKHEKPRSLRRLLEASGCGCQGHPRCLVSHWRPRQIRRGRRALSRRSRRRHDHQRWRRSRQSLDPAGLGRNAESSYSCLHGTDKIAARARVIVTQCAPQILPARRRGRNRMRMSQAIASSRPTPMAYFSMTH
jgi:hypothetical protein